MATQHWNKMVMCLVFVFTTISHAGKQVSEAEIAMKKNLGRNNGVACLACHQSEPTSKPIRY